MRMLVTAKLSALAAKNPWLACLQPQGGDVAGDQVYVAMQIGHPKAVDHVVRRQLEQHRSANRKVQFIGRGHYLAWDWRGILDVPPPLVSGDFDLQRLGCGQRCQCPLGPEVCHQKPEQHEPGNDHSSNDDPGRPPLSLWCGDALVM